MQEGVSGTAGQASAPSAAPEHTIVGDAWKREGESGVMPPRFGSAAQKQDTIVTKGTATRKLRRGVL